MCNNNDNNNNNNRDSNSTIASDIIPCILSNSRHNITTRSLLPIDHYRLELYQYTIAERLRYPMMNSFSSGLPCYPFLPRIMQPEEPKPQHSYIGLIAMAILSTPEGKLVLSDIYQHILDHYPYFRTRGPGWRNSIRHNLSLNDCFIKVGRSANGKGHYWAIHPANIDDFRKGDFRRRKAQRKVRKHMGLDVDNDSLDSSSPPPPIASSPSVQSVCGPSSSIIPQSLNKLVSTTSAPIITSTMTNMITTTTTTITYQHNNDQNCKKSNKKRRRRQFNMDSLLAPDSSDENNLNDDLDQSDLIVAKKSNRSCSSSSTSASTSVSTKLWPTFPFVDYYQVLLQSQIEPEINSHLDS